MKENKSNSYISKEEFYLILETDPESIFNLVNRLLGTIDALEQRIIKLESQIFSDIFKVPLSEGSIYNTINNFSLKLSSFQKRINKQLLLSDILHFDETGIRIEGKLHWIHSISNEKYTLYVPHTKRGTIAMGR